MTQLFFDNERFYRFVKHDASSFCTSGYSMGGSRINLPLSHISRSSLRYFEMNSLTNAFALTGKTHSINSPDCMQNGAS